MIRSFDEILVQKAEKSSIRDMYIYMDKRFDTKILQTGQNEATQNQINLLTQSIKDIKDQYKADFESIRKKLTLQIQNATQHLRSSYFNQ